MSLPEEDASAIDRATRTLQIIVGALVMGLVVFLVITLFVHPESKPVATAPAGMPAQSQPEAQAPVLPVITVAAFTVAVVCLPLALVVPRLAADSARKQIAAGKWNPAKVYGGKPLPTSDAGRLTLVYQTQKITSVAMVEGPACLALIAYMLERNTVALGLGLFLIAAVAVQFPQRARVQQGIDDQLGRLDMDRQTV